MFKPAPEFDRFMTAWHALPRTVHPILPCKRDINPGSLGDFLHATGIAEMIAPGNLRVLYAGSGYERAASTDITGKNYYDLLPKAFHKAMMTFHRNLFETPCGAFVGDVITTVSGNSYLHETVQLPLSGDDGRIRYLVSFGIGRKPLGDQGLRSPGNHNAANIRQLHYIDLGAGAPDEYIENFQFYRARR